MARVKRNLIGMQFGEWTVVSYLGNSLWECVCSCGVVKNILTGKLTSGQTMSCGHAKTIDLKGQRFGDWDVIEYVGNSMWKCKCTCGTIKEVSSRHLRNGVSKDCGHTGSSKRIDLTGQVFGEYTVLKYAGDKRWLCKCSCGKIKEIDGYRLRDGLVKSCGHSGKLIDETGKEFGDLTVLSYDGTRYICRCKCGNITSVTGSNLRSGSTQSCGCKQVSLYTSEYISNKIDSYKEINGCLPFKQELAEQLGISYSYLLILAREYGLGDKFDKTFSSAPEKEIYNIIKNIDSNINILIHSRDILKSGNEIDIFIPDRKLAIEFNGDYWHSDMNKGINYHQDKTIECAKRGIHLIHIFEYEWKDEYLKNKIVELIKSKIGKSNKEIVQARKCSISNIEVEKERSFEDRYHLQGYASSTVAYGLLDSKGELISIMTFGKPRFNKDYEWELVRYCTKPGIATVGGAEKLFKHFIKEHNPTSIISYCDISKFTGRVYFKLGFKATEKDITSPNYKWVKPNKNEVLSRYQTQKHKLLELGYGVYGSTEDEIMNTLGYYKIYDSGNLRLSWNKPV